jgi:hypothetical protein
MNKKNFVSIAPYRRGLPKRKFADGGVSAERPDLDILARQGLSPEKAPGLPPRIGKEQIFGKMSGANTGGKTNVVVTRAPDDEVRWDEGKGSVLKEMTNTAADKVQSAHDEARAKAGLKEFYRKQKPKRMAVGGVYGDRSRPLYGDPAPLSPEEERDARIAAYGFDPLEGMSRPTTSAQAAAPLPVGPVPRPAPTAPTPAAMPQIMAQAQPPAPVRPTAPPAPAPAPAPTPAAGGVTSATAPETASNRPVLRSPDANSPGPGRAIDWRKAGRVAADTMVDSGSPVNALAALGGNALRQYLRGRKDPVTSPGNEAARRGVDMRNPPQVENMDTNEPQLQRPAGGSTVPGQVAGNGGFGVGVGVPGIDEWGFPTYGGTRPTFPDDSVRNLAKGGSVLGYAKGGTVAIEDTEGDSPRAKAKRERQLGDVGKPAEDLPPERKAKGGSIKRRRPTSKKKLGRGEKLPVPMVTDEDMGPPPTPPGPPLAAPVAPAPVSAPPPGPPMAAMNKGGGVETKGDSCPKMAAGGVAKVRRGYPNTNKTTKRMATGGAVRGCGAATKGKGFSGVY